MCCLQNGRNSSRLYYGNPGARGAALVVRKVPAQICDNCGEAYVSAEVTRSLLQSAREALRAGVEVDIREFVATTV